MVVWALLLDWLMPAAHPLALYPLLAFFPLVSLLHIYLMFDGRALKRLDALFYALVHIPLSFVVWTFCISLVMGKAIG